MHRPCPARTRPRAAPRWRSARLALQPLGTSCRSWGRQVILDISPPSAYTSAPSEALLPVAGHSLLDDADAVLSREQAAEHDVASDVSGTTAASAVHRLSAWSCGERINRREPTWQERSRLAGQGIGQRREKAEATSETRNERALACSESGWTLTTVQVKDQHGFPRIATFPVARPLAEGALTEDDGLSGHGCRFRMSVVL